MLVDLNCDLGESFGRYGLGEDEAMLRVVTSARFPYSPNSTLRVVFAANSIKLSQG